MNIRIRQSGGFAGVEQNLGSVDTSDLAQEKATRLEKCIAELKRFEAAAGEAPVGADMFRYQIEIRDDQGARQTLVFVHGEPEEAPEPLQELLEAVEASG